MAAGLLCNKDASISVYGLQLRAVVCPKPSFAPSAWKNKIKSIGTLSVIRNSGKKRFQTLILRAEQEKNANPPTTSNSTKNHEKNPPHDSSTDSKPKPINTNGSRKPDQRWNNKKWKWREILGMQFREVVGLFMQVGVVFFLMRLLRPRMPFGGEVRVPTSFSSVPYSQFLSRVKKNEVLKVEMDDDHFTFQLKPEVEAASGGAGAGGDSVDVAKVKRVLYTTTKPSGVSLPYDEMLENQVEFGAPEKRSGGFFNSAMVALLYIALFAGLIQRLPFRFQFSSGRLGSPKTRSSGSSKTLEQGENVTFADVAGVDEAKEELEEIVEFLRNPDRYTRVGARPPRGVLLVGLPGTGKTLLAKAVAGEAEVPFISCSASEFVELYVGMGASRVRELFAKAKKDAPSIIFIDEIDAVAKSRDGRIRVVSNDEREQTLNQLLTEMDGFDSSSAVIVLGATNRADVLDPALRRPGRFDRIVTVEAPDRTGREAILKVHASKRQLPLSSDVDLKAIATATTGFTGADLANIVNEAALLAGRANKQEVSKEDFIQAVERSIAGIEKKRSTLQRSEKGVVARHEVGHAICGTAVANLLPGQSQVAKLSILPRSGGALGFTYTPPSNEDRYLLFIDELRGRLVTLLGGRAAEEVAYSGRVSTGALDDIKRATDMAYKAIAEYGLNQSIGPVSIATLSSGGLDDSGGAAPWTRDQGQVLDLVQKEVKDLLQSALEVALAVVRSNPTVLEGLGSELEANEKMDGELLRDWLKLVISPIELGSFIKGEYKKKIEDSIDVEVATPASAETIK